MADETATTGETPISTPTKPISTPTGETPISTPTEEPEKPKARRGRPRKTPVPKPEEPKPEAKPDEAKPGPDTEPEEPKPEPEAKPEVGAPANPVAGLSVVVLTTPGRKERATKLAKELGAEVLVSETGFSSDAYAAAWLKAKAKAVSPDAWVGVLDDGVVDVDQDALGDALDAAPADVASLFLGEAAVKGSSAPLARKPHYAITYQVHNHAAVFMRASLAGRAAEYLAASHLPARQALEVWAQRASQPVAYPLPSLVGYRGNEAAVTGVREKWDGSTVELLDRPTLIRYGRRYGKAKGSFR